MTTNQNNQESFDELKQKLSIQLEVAHINIQNALSNINDESAFSSEFFPHVASLLTETLRRVGQAGVTYGLMASLHLMGDDVEDCENGQH